MAAAHGRAQPRSVAAGVSITSNPGKHNPKSYDIYSAGPDGNPDNADDIGNWESTTN